MTNHKINFLILLLVIHVLNKCDLWSYEDCSLKNLLNTFKRVFTTGNYEMYFDYGSIKNLLKFSRRNWFFIWFCRQNFTNWVICTYTFWKHIRTYIHLSIHSHIQTFISNINSNWIYNLKVTLLQTFQMLSISLAECQFWGFSLVISYGHWF